MTELQHLLDRSMRDAGPHLAGIVEPARRVPAAELVAMLIGMRLLVTATVTGDGRPLSAPTDGYFLHGQWHFSIGRSSVRARQLARRPSVSVTHLPGVELAVTVHGRAEMYELGDPQRPGLRRAMLDHYIPLQGPGFEEALDGLDAVAVRVEPTRIFAARF